jgi:Tfp pilus assembly protein PilX
MPKRNRRGIILFIVIMVVMVVAILSTIILRVVTNHSTLTHHQVSRIQAEYAAKAGVIYALDTLRRNDAAAAACWAGGGMIMRKAGLAACVVLEPNLPSSVTQVNITVGAPGSGISGTRRVSARATYTYTP